MPSPALLLLAALASCASSAPALAQAASAPTPEEHLGRPVGADFELADWDEVSSYFRALGAASPHVDVRRVGTTTEGREFLLAVIGSEENLAREEELRELAASVADPRGLDAAGRERVLDRAVPFLFVSIGMHSTETAAPQFGMELAHRLATSDEEPYRTAREELVCVLFPCLNPDGLDHVVSWYRETVHTPHEGADLLKLYQYYTGHDNNRDWFGLTQNETRIVTEQLYSVWRPQIYWDVHQQGGRRERFFVPPYKDPLNPNLDPAVIAGIGTLGGRALFDMTREGLTGISTGVTYDMWWNGGNRNVPVRHNVIGILTEAASVNIASPVFLAPEELAAPRGLGEYAPSNQFPEPWPGGWWRLRDIIDYEHAFGRSLLASIAREPRTWLANAMAASARAIERGAEKAPRAWLIPSDDPNRAAVRRMVDDLILGGVEVSRATSAIEVDGRSWPAGTIVILAEQPYGSHVKDLFEVQRYPDGDPPYDVAGWTLPLLFGVHRVECIDAPEGELAPVASGAEALAGFEADPDAPAGLDSRDGDAWRAAFERLAAGEPVTWVHDGEQAGRIVPEEEAGEGRIVVDAMPRIGIYSPWRGSMDEGWLRWVFDAHGLPFVRVRNEMVRAGSLQDFLDVLFVPSIGPSTLDEGRAPGSVPAAFARGLDPEGAIAVEEFVRGGGVLVTMASSARWAIELFDLDVEDATRGEDEDDEGSEEPDEDEPEFSCPGSVLRAVPEEHALTAGLPLSLAVFFSRSAAWELPEADGEKGEEDEDAGVIEELLTYAPTRILLSGWIRAPEVIAEKGAWVRARHGEGWVHLFGFRPQYRGWCEGVFQLLFRAALFGGAG